MLYKQVLVLYEQYSTVQYEPQHGNCGGVGPVIGNWTEMTHDCPTYERGMSQEGGVPGIRNVKQS